MEWAKEKRTGSTAVALGPQDKPMVGQGLSQEELNKGNLGRSLKDGTKVDTDISGKIANGKPNLAVATLFLNTINSSFVVLNV